MEGGHLSFFVGEHMQYLTTVLKLTNFYNPLDKKAEGDLIYDDRIVGEDDFEKSLEKVFEHYDI